MQPRIAHASGQSPSSAEIVIGRLLKDAKGPLPDLLARVVTSLHALVRETRPTRAEWCDVIAFLTDVGQASDELRQEWVLLSDLLGVTALVEEINSQHSRGVTPNTARGAFYRADAPWLPLGANLSLDGVGEPLSVRVRIHDLDGRPVSGATVATWQANGQGFYENQFPDLQPDRNLRGIFSADQAGQVHYLTVKPAGYAVPNDGPVGQLLGRIGYVPRRPAHLHFIVAADGFETITTQIFDGADPLLAEDALFNAKPDLAGDFRKEVAQDGRVRWSLDFTFVMARAAARRQ
ncbi:dioxygenase family protein [Methylovirgula sp. 4M-Z18]|uniref:dioxygenase family protein n=1 Tax=Methylovirgula sp. 4M-Z18 TaxID=2293567 RepID=UPI000E2F7765|nr:dioxygenase [Methylovirgula sp. 4M-Z18]RFB75604.1 6-chlorohydroxyquinol-1,2-dioxygenase [Methylovirgula sp. 4M-Z18]